MKHKEIIKAWLDGATIQYYVNEGTNSDFENTWVDIMMADNTKYMHMFADHHKYRIKPQAKKYRVALMNYSSNIKLPNVIHETSNMYEYERSPNFVKWLTDWIEYDV